MSADQNHILNLKSANDRVYYLYMWVREKRKTKRLEVQNHFDWGDGIMNRTHSALMSKFDNEIDWYSKKQQYTWITSVQEKLI